MTPKDNMTELMSFKQGEEESLRDFVKGYHRTVLNLGTFNHPQALRGLKEGLRVSRPWYNLRTPVINSYSVAYEQAKIDI